MGPAAFGGFCWEKQLTQPAPSPQAGWCSSTPSCSFIHLSTKSLILLQLQCRGRPRSEQNPAAMGCSHPTFPGAGSGTEVTGGCWAACGCCCPILATPMPQRGLVQSHPPRGALKEQQLASAIGSGWAFSCIITAVRIIKHFYHSSSREPHPAPVHSV